MTQGSSHHRIQTFHCRCQPRLRYTAPSVNSGHPSGEGGLTLIEHYSDAELKLLKQFFEDYCELQPRTPTGFERLNNGEAFDALHRDCLVLL